ncbi:MAG: hypothetical protein LAT68_12700 [Cyclobacteriaceae bacterium]|nr:hypothetical protein [Cyclobacteriaceae bacterium]MCH8517178.1 hypothetical protein [Cyclobacteriaceae bacterium]
MPQMLNLGSEILRINPSNNQILEYSPNGGRSWSTRYRGPNYGDFIDLNDIGSEILATTSKGTYVSTSNGRSWTKRS